MQQSRTPSPSPNQTGSPPHTVVRFTPPKRQAGKRRKKVKLQEFQTTYTTLSHALPTDALMMPGTYTAKSTRRQCHGERLRGPFLLLVVKLSAADHRAHPLSPPQASVCSARWTLS